ARAFRSREAAPPLPQRVPPLAPLRIPRAIGFRAHPRRLGGMVALFSRGGEDDRRAELRARRRALETGRRRSRPPARRCKLTASRPAALRGAAAPPPRLRALRARAARPRRVHRPRSDRCARADG